MKQTWKRLTAAFLAVMMMICMVPELTAKAAGELDVQAVFQCGANVTGTLDITGTLTLTGTGSTYAADTSYWTYRRDYNNMWYDSENDVRYQDRINRVVIGDGITSIGARLFYDCANLNSVSIGKNVESIGEYAFSDCQMLRDIDIPGNVQTIGSNAFVKSGLRTVTMHMGLRIISEYAFDETRLTSVVIPENTVNIESKAFGGSVKNITISKGVAVIQAGAFQAEYAYVDVQEDNVVLSAGAFGEGTTLKGKAGSTAEQFVKDADDGYYKFEAKPVLVTFNANKGNCRVVSKKVTPGEYYGTLPVPTKKKYTFVGWYTKAKGGTKVTNLSTVRKNNHTLYAHWKKVSVAKAKKPTVKSTAKKKAKITIKKVSGAAGYQVRYATKKSMKAAKTKTTTKKNLTLSGLKSKKRYYVQVRAYKKDSTGKKIYGAWSTVKAVKIK